MRYGQRLVSIRQGGIGGDAAVCPFYPAAMTFTVTFVIHSKQFPRKRLPASPLDAMMLRAWVDTGRWGHGTPTGNTQLSYPPHTRDSLCEHFGFTEGVDTAQANLGKFLLLEPTGKCDYLLEVLRREGRNDRRLGDGGKIMLGQLVDHAAAFDPYAHVGAWVHLMAGSGRVVPPSQVREFDTVAEILTADITSDELVVVRLAGQHKSPAL